MNRYLILIAGLVVSRLLAQTPPAGADPLSAEAELASLRVLPGFTANLFASEKNGVIKPIQIRFDGDGRLWVAGSVAYPQLQPGQKADDKIVVLEDTDHDGVADKTTVFADGLLMPTGLELGDGGVYVGTGTELLHLRDTDGDSRADERRVIFSGFGTGDTHQTINSFTWGPSGELMFSQGLHAISRVETPWGTEQLRQSGVWRYWPKRGRLDAFWDGAMGGHNPFGTAFDHWGRPFVVAGNGHGIYDLTPAMIRTEHFQLQPSIWSQGRKFGGADFVENSHWPTNHQGELVSGGYLQNTVERFRIFAQGASFGADRLLPLVESTNTAFRIVDLRFGPDGALYLCDWCNPVIGHYQASFRHPDRDKTHGRIWRITANNRPTVAWQPLEKVPITQLVEALLSPERWNRQLAKRILQDRPAADVLRVLDFRNSQLTPGIAAAEPAMLEYLGVYAALEVVRRDLVALATAASAPELRAFGARVIGHWADRLEKPLELLAPMADHTDLGVRLEVIVACSYVHEARAVEVAARALDGTADAALQYAFGQTVQALKPYWREPFARGELKFDGVPERLAAFTRADRSAATVALAISRLRRVGEVALPTEVQLGLLQTVADAGGPADLDILVPTNSYTIGTNYLAAEHRRFLDSLADAARRRGLRPTDSFATRLQPLILAGDLNVRGAALRLAGAFGITNLHPQALRLARTSATPVPVRVGAMSALAAYGGPEDRALLTLLAGDSATAEAVRARALAELAHLAPGNAALAAAFLARQPTESSATEVLAAWLARAEATTALAQAMTQQNTPREIAQLGLRLMATSGRRHEALAAKWERDSGRSSQARNWTAAETAAFLTQVRSHGDSARGEEVFRRPELGCTSCHSVGNSGPGLGPDLGALGTAQTPDFIVGAILEPQREVKEGFNSVAITLNDGEELTGHIVNEETAALVLHDTLTRQNVRLARGQIRDRHNLGSVMPAGLADSLTPSEFRDLVRYLAGLGRREQ